MIFSLHQASQIRYYRNICCYYKVTSRYQGCYGQFKYNNEFNNNKFFLVVKSISSNLKLFWKNSLLSASKHLQYRLVRENEVQTLHHKGSVPLYLQIFVEDLLFSMLRYYISLDQWTIGERNFTHFTINTAAIYTQVLYI